ncbi:conserved fungal protein [Venturia nashicola]|uniref:Conserved fungal protein n=1 Tax=Venturia nashicola TaxID=86259 RepID=A0A4Z1NDK0_9PEZI|nr:conserved fungal protein [Venturia nashicola]TLD18749.1 conserved fungal protein [Venturia nashicola]
MNNDAGPSALETTSHTPNSPSPSTSTPTEAEDESAPYRFSAKRRLDDLIFNLDRLILAELAILYYIDNSFICLALRAGFQNLYMRRPPPSAPAAPLIYANIICFLLHLYRKQPEAGEALRGYLHGGLLLDFIGQHGPTSKWHLFLMDIFLTILQLLSHALADKRKGMDKSRVTADLDAEERGESESDVIASGQAMVAEVYLSEIAFYS